MGAGAADEPRAVGLEGMERMTWQPIETAPKDGSWVLLFLPEWGRGQARIGQWIRSREDSGWYGREFKEVFNDGPTHWMPLPDSPTEAA